MIVFRSPRACLAQSRLCAVWAALLIPVYTVSELRQSHLMDLVRSGDVHAQPNCKIFAHGPGFLSINKVADSPAA